MIPPLFYGYVLLTTGSGLAHSTFHVRHRADICNSDKIGYAVVDAVSPYCGQSCWPTTS